MEYKINIVHGMENYLQKYFNKDERFFTNKHLLGMSEVFRGMVIKQ